jgi:two-component system phosphate regulon sensor histidine kinase PhoR
MFVRVAGVLILGGLIGWLFAMPVVGLLAAALVLLAWELFNLQKLYRYLNGDKSQSLPDGSGVWPQVFNRIQHMRSRSAHRRKRYRQLVKEVRSSAKMFPDGGIILNENNEVLLHNSAARSLLGLRKKTSKGRRIESLVGVPELSDYLGRGDFADPVEIASPVDGESWLLCQLIPYGPDQRLLLVRDVSQQRRLDDMRRDFVANASHELRTPLTVIKGYLEALVDADDLADEYRLPVREMQRQSDRMQDLVDDLLLLSELESTEPDGALKPVELAPMLHSAKLEALSMAGCPDTITVHTGTPMRLRARADDIRSVLSNLVSNAVRHTPADGSITLEWSADETSGSLSVADTGCGIPRDQLARITERFYRVDAGRGEGGGTGLGLAIVKHALARYGATLDIESEYGHGSRFICRFPAERLAAE